MGHPVAARGAMLLTLLALTLGAALALPAAPAAAAPRALIAFLPSAPEPGFPLLDELARRGLDVAVTSPTTGGYKPRQMVLDLSQGARISTRVYDEPVPRLDLIRLPGGGGRVGGWTEAVRRADDAPGTVVPGLLGDAVRRAGGGTAYAGVRGARHAVAAAAADRAGRIGRVELTGRARLGERAADLWRTVRLLVVGLPADAPGLAVLDRLLAARTGEDFVYVVRAPPRGTLKLLPSGVEGEGPSTALRSRTTRRDGLVAATDVAPTALRRLGIVVPDDMQGRTIEPAAGDARDVRDLAERLDVVQSRRWPELRAFAAGWLALLAVLAAVAGRRGLMTARRVLLLALTWLPGVALLTAGLAPGRSTEIAVLTAGSLGLGLATDAVFRWPRAMAVPAAAVLAAHVVDLAFGSPLIARSLAGPNPKAGARFYGIGNELEVILAMMVLLGAGAAFARLPPRRAAQAIGACCLVFAGVFGAGRLGADVGAVITLGAGAAGAAVACLPGRPSRRALALAVAVPLAAVLALVLLDVVTAGGAHLTRSVVEAEDPGELLDILRRRLDISLSGLGAGTTPVSAAAAVAMLVYGWLRRRELLSPIWGSTAMRAGFAGGLSATVVGAISNDSGPVILLVGTAALAFAVLYVRSPPREARMIKCA